jgi:hypothetical protein
VKRPKLLWPIVVVSLVVVVTVLVILLVPIAEPQMLSFVLRGDSSPPWQMKVCMPSRGTPMDIVWNTTAPPGFTLLIITSSGSHLVFTSANGSVNLTSLGGYYFFQAENATSSSGVDVDVSFEVRATLPELASGPTRC